MRSIYPGSPLTLGATLQDSIWNFAIATPHPSIELVLGDYKTGKIIERFLLDPEKNRTGNIWHIGLQAYEDRLLYGYCLKSIKHPSCSKCASFAADPYARLVKTGNSWGNNAWEHLDTEQLISVAFKEQSETCPCKTHRKTNRIIYEAHIRGATKDPTSSVKYPGTFLGLIEKLDHLKKLGITTIELLPIFEWDESEWNRLNPKTKKRLSNYWGYSPLSFFSPMQRFGTTPDPITTSHECKELINACHDQGLEVILDVVYNHTGEGNQHGPAYSYKLLDQNAYYIMNPSDGTFTNYSGCGNSLNANHPQVSTLILSSLRYWASVYHVDGFRFDLASALSRNQLGDPMSEPPLLESVSKDPLLANTILIVEPWDAAGLYHTGTIYQLNQKKEHLFAEWNDRYRDDVRQFITGKTGMAGLFATRLCGSSDLYAESLKSTINYVTSHDGFSLYDLVSYNHKHNAENGEHNRDGADNNYSWNCGVEGLSSKKTVTNLRYRQMINFLSALLMSQGTPMLLMGDEYSHTKNGNNNAWCQDSEENWINWKKLKENIALQELIATLCHLRIKSDCFHLDRSLTDSSIQWHGQKLKNPSWEAESSLVACTLCDTKNSPQLFLAWNSGPSSITIEVPKLPEGSWRVVVNSSCLPNKAVFPTLKGPCLEGRAVLSPHSCLILYKSLTT